jgi:hypothetical protein
LTLHESVLRVDTSREKCLQWPKSGSSAGQRTF